MDPLFLSLGEILGMHEQQVYTADRTAFATPPGWNPPSPRPKLYSVASFCTPRFRQWQRRTCFTCGGITRLSMANKRVGSNAPITFLLINDWTPPFDEAELAELLPAVVSSRMGKQEGIDGSVRIAV